MPHIGNLTKVTRQDVAKLIDRVNDRGSPIASNRLLACISAMFNWAIREGHLEDNPARMISKRGVEQSRERILTPVEIRRFWCGIDNAHPMSEPVRDLLRLALLTGQRRGEIAQKPEVEDGVWVLRHTKNGRTHRVPLAPIAAGIMSRRKGAFSAHSATRAWDRVRASLGLSDVRVHDLRRTFASNLAQLGVDRVVIAKCLNHVSIDRATITGAVYDRYNYEREKLAAFSLWEQTLLTIIQEDEADTSSS